MSDRFRCLAALALGAVILLFTAWVYWPGQTGPALLDDATSVLVIGDLKNHPEMAWDYILGDTSGPLGRPVSMASFVLEKLLLDGELETSKRVNILLHLGNGALVIWLFWLLFRFLGTPGYRVVALVLGAAWLLSPLYVSTVLYIVQRMAMLSSTFMLLACISFIYWRSRLSAGEFSVAMLGLVAVNFCLAMLAKENAIVLVPTLLLLEALWFGFRDESGRVIRWLQLMTLGSIAVGGLALVVVLIVDYEGLAGAFGFRYFTLDERLLTQARIVWDYAGQIYAPDVSVMGLYHDDVVVSKSLHEPASTLYAVVAWLFVVLSLALLMLRPWGRYLALGVAWFLVGHSIESSVFPLELYFEHRNYFPGIGLFLLLGALYAQVVRRWPLTSTPLLVYLACYALWLSSLTGSQVQIWSSHPLLILNNLNAHPDSYRANSDMAVQLANVGAFAEAQKYSARAYSLSVAGEHSGDHDIRDLALACIANQPVSPDQIHRLGTENPARPFGSVVTLQTMVHLLQDNACPDFDRVGFADRMAEIFLAENTPSTASANIYAGLALLENTLQRWQNALAYSELYLRSSPANAQGLLMKLHFASALGKVDEAATVAALLQEMDAQGKLTVGQRQTLSLYLEH
jgi:protein O-mannosyl-transferase